MLKITLDFVFPKKCLDCHAPDFWLCPQCLKKIRIDAKIICPICNQVLKPQHSKQHYSEKNYLDGLIVTNDWSDPVFKKLIYNFKYNFISELQQILGSFLTQGLEKLIIQNNLGNLGQFKNPILIPIPLHHLRLRWRGFNQAKILCQLISGKFSWPTNDQIIFRHKNTKPQMTIDNIDQRKRNAKNIFSLKTNLENNSNDLSKRTIFLVDDVCTTGSTLQGAAKCLRTRFPSCTIYGLVLARA